jgi:PAS domain S-box-containing protein
MEMYHHQLWREKIADVGYRTFLTMHDLSPHATVLYASDSIDDVLGYEPEEVVGKSCFDYFHPEELPFARDIHGESIQFDNAAVLSYCRYVTIIYYQC